MPLPHLALIGRAVERRRGSKGTRGGVRRLADRRAQKDGPLPHHRDSQRYRVTGVREEATKRGFEPGERTLYRACRQMRRRSGRPRTFKLDILTGGVNSRGVQGFKGAIPGPCSNIMDTIIAADNRGLPWQKNGPRYSAIRA